MNQVSHSLKATRLQDLSELECAALHKVALEYLEDVVAVPRDGSYALSKKHSLRKKYANYLSTARDKNKERDRVFGIPLADVVENDQLLRLQKSDSFAAFYSDITENGNGPNEYKVPVTCCSPTAHATIHSTSGVSSDSSSTEALHEADQARSNSKISNKKAVNASSPDTNLRRNNSKRNETRPLKRRGAIVNDSLNEIDPYQSQLLEALSLSETTHNHKKNNNRSLLPPTMVQVPYVVQKCCDHIAEYGIHVTGIFRVAGSKKRVKQLREEFDQGVDVDINAEYNPHDVAALLKEFLRDLPEALLTKDLYSAFIFTTALKGQERISALQALIWLLPQTNRDTLHTLVKFLSKISRFAEPTSDELGNQIEGNKMTVTNLATIFGPNILHRFKKSNSDSSQHQVQKHLPDDSSAVIETVISIFKNHEELFQIPQHIQTKILRLLKETHPDAVEYLLRRKNAQNMRTVSTTSEKSVKKETEQSDGKPEVQPVVTTTRLSYQQAIGQFKPTLRNKTQLSWNRLPEERKLLTKIDDLAWKRQRPKSANGSKWLSDTMNAVGEFRLLSNRLADHAKYLAVVEADETRGTVEDNLRNTADNTQVVSRDSFKIARKVNNSESNNTQTAPEVLRRGGVSFNLVESNNQSISEKLNNDFKSSKEDVNFTDENGDNLPGCELDFKDIETSLQVDRTWSTTSLFDCNSNYSLEETINNLESGVQISLPKAPAHIRTWGAAGLSLKVQRKYNTPSTILSENGGCMRGDSFKNNSTGPKPLPHTSDVQSHCIDAKGSAWYKDNSARNAQQLARYTRTYQMEDLNKAELELLSSSISRHNDKHARVSRMSDHVSGNHKRDVYKSYNIVQPNDGLKWLTESHI